MATASLARVGTAMTANAMLPQLRVFAVEELDGRMMAISGVYNALRSGTQAGSAEREDDRRDTDSTATRPGDAIPAESIDALLAVVRRRLSGQARASSVSVVVLEELMDALAQQLRLLWDELAGTGEAVVDRRLSASSRPRSDAVDGRVQRYVVAVCAHLFEQYLHKARVLDERGLFSASANSIRLRTQLSAEASQILDADRLRRLLHDSPVREASALAAGPIRRVLDTAEEVKPPCSLSSARARLLQQIHSRVSANAHVLASRGGHSDQPEGGRQERLSEDELPPTQRLSSAESAPDLAGWQALDWPEGDEPIRAASAHPAARDETHPSASSGAVPARPADDLKQLTAQWSLSARQTSDDMSPLVHVVTGHREHADKMSALADRMSALDAEQAAFLVGMRSPLAETACVQPTSVSGEGGRCQPLRPSQRAMKSHVTLHPRSPVFNHLVDEIESDAVEFMDRNVAASGEVRDVYCELAHTLGREYARPAEDGFLLPASSALNLGEGLSSASLHLAPKERVLNASLLRDGARTPWSQQLSAWAKTPLSPPHDRRLGGALNPVSALTPFPRRHVERLQLKREEASHEDEYHRQAAMLDVQKQSRSFASWLSWWKSTLSTDDFLKYVATQESDYLRVIFHLYDGEATGEGRHEDSDDDELKASKERARLKDAARGEKEVLLRQLRAQKSAFQRGEWNALCVTLGGLGREPELRAHEDPTLRPELQDRADSSLHAQTVANVNLFGRADASSLLVRSDTPRRTEVGTPSLSEMQRRLERVWSSLGTPDELVLDMAVKYSEAQTALLADVIECWERASELIVARERLLSSLESFERSASDPNRFFEKGARGSSSARLAEAKHRAHLYEHLSRVEAPLRELLSSVATRFGDVVSYCGRAYGEKMQHDRTEMLYHLQEERRQRRVHELPVHVSQSS